MRLKFFIVILLIFQFSLAQENNSPDADTLTVVITTSDGGEIIGSIQSETEDGYKIKTPAGLMIEIPKTAIVRIEQFGGKVENGKIFHADPNRSMYLFSPSAFPIDKNMGYCRDFCVFFPSINYGFGDVFSVQGGAFWFPGTPLEETPLVGSAKFTFLQKSKIAGAGGIMYIRLPSFYESDSNMGMGFTFVTATYGNQFSHMSASTGWGFIQDNGKWDFMNRPILVLSGNNRISNSIALVTENWFFPNMDLNDAILSISIRYFGRRIAVDVGGLFTLNMLLEGAPFPVLNFTYHFNKKKK